MTVELVVLICGVSMAIAGVFAALAFVQFRMRHPREAQVVGFSESTLAAIGR